MGSQAGFELGGEMWACRALAHATIGCANRGSPCIPVLIATSGLGS